MTKKELADAKSGYIRGVTKVCQMIKQAKFKSANAFYLGMKIASPLSIEDRWAIEENVIAQYYINPIEFRERVREKE